MTRYNNPHRSRGISLIEALIAILVLGAGLLAVAKFQGGLTASSGQTKARAEAVQLARDRIEQLRNLITATQHANLAGGSDTPTGVAASFTRNWSVTGTDPVQIRVSVTWDDPKDGTQTVALTSLIAWDNPELSVSLASGTLPGGGFLKPPTGRAVMVGGESYENPPSGTDNGDGTRIVTLDGGGKELVDIATGRILMRIKDGSAFSTISGRLYFDTQVKSGDEDNFSIMTSDAAYCTMGSTTTADGSEYRYFNYKCYIGPEWYGNIGVVSTQRTNNQSRVCVGDPTQSVQYNEDSSVFSGSKHPALSTIRTYRGYELVSEEPEWWTSLGIGIGADGSYTPTHYTDHHFLVTKITGTAQDSSCGGQMNHSPYPFTGNPGKFVCLSESCPTELPDGTPPYTTFEGTITAVGGGTLPHNGDFGLSITAGSCSLNVAPHKKSATYHCKIEWLGWTGGTWAGKMIVADGAAETGADVCSIDPTTPTSDELPLPEGVTWDGIITMGDNDRFEDEVGYDSSDKNYGVIDFIDFPPAVENLPMDFTIAPTGSAPACRL